MEGTSEMVEPWNHSMVGFVGTSEMVELWNHSMVGLEGTSEITEPQNFLPAPKLSLSLIWKPCPPVLPPPNHAVPDPPPSAGSHSHGMWVGFPLCFCWRKLPVCPWGGAWRWAGGSAFLAGVGQETPGQTDERFLFPLLKRSQTILNGRICDAFAWHGVSFAVTRSLHPLGSSSPLRDVGSSHRAPLCAYLQPRSQELPPGVSPQVQRGRPAAGEHPVPCWWVPPWRGCVQWDPSPAADFTALRSSSLRFLSSPQLRG